jgi:putative acetyltransferase
MLIRRFRAGDEAALFQVFFSAIHKIAARDYTPEQIEAWAPGDVDWSGWETRIRGINPFVAVRGQEIVGYADVQIGGYIDHFFVSGLHPRQGIGSLLMNRLTQEAVEHQYAELTSHVSKTAEPLFVRCGFQVLQRKYAVIRGVELPHALMCKKIR